MSAPDGMEWEAEERIDWDPIHLRYHRRQLSLVVRREGHPVYRFGYADSEGYLLLARDVVRWGIGSTLVRVENRRHAEQVIRALENIKGGNG